MKTPVDMEALIAETRRLREKFELTKARHSLGEATYDEMVRAAKVFAEAFDAYHFAKYGKHKRPSWASLIR